MSVLGMCGRKLQGKRAGLPKSVPPSIQPYSCAPTPLTTPGGWCGCSAAGLRVGAPKASALQAVSAWLRERPAEAVRARPALAAMMWAAAAPRHSASTCVEGGGCGTGWLVGGGLGTWVPGQQGRDDLCCQAAGAGALVAAPEASSIRAKPRRPWRPQSWPGQPARSPRRA